jgi:hypothetical protein
MYPIPLCDREAREKVPSVAGCRDRSIAGVMLPRFVLSIHHVTISFVFFPSGIWRVASREYDILLLKRGKYATPMSMPRRKRKQIH